MKKLFILAFVMISPSVLAVGSVTSDNLKVMQVEITNTGYVYFTTNGYQCGRNHFAINPNAIGVKSMTAALLAAATTGSYIKVTTMACSMVSTDSSTPLEARGVILMYTNY